MQERYLGDSHDYAKYSLLRHFCVALGVRVGLNWYLTQSVLVDKVGNNDGEKRHHLRGAAWQGWEEDLLHQLSQLQLVTDRHLGQFYRLGILPSDTLYLDAPVPVAERQLWHRSARTTMSGADLVFMDPDNGFEVASMTRKTTPKYAFYSEAADYVADGKIVVAIQFARQCDPRHRACSVRQRLSQSIGKEIKIPVIRARVAPNLLFVTAAPGHMEEDVASVIASFANRREKIELIP